MPQVTKAIGLFLLTDQAQGEKDADFTHTPANDNR
jgi:hypothetical protein